MQEKHGLLYKHRSTARPQLTEQHAFNRLMWTADMLKGINGLRLLAKTASLKAIQIVTNLSAGHPLKIINAQEKPLPCL